MRLGNLESTLSLTIDGTSYSIPGGQIKSLDLDLRNHGFQGQLDFVLFDDSDHEGSFEDTLYDSFITSTLATVSLEFKWTYWDDETSIDLESISLSGMVTDKKLRVHMYRRTGDVPILARRYHIEFADPAQVMWRQHHPVQLYTETSVSDILTEYAGTAFTIDCQWDDLTESEDLFFVHLPEKHDASFYDFLFWYLDRQGGLWEYDYENSQYVIRSEKDSASTATQLYADDVAEIELIWPAVPRYTPRVLNSYADDASSQEVENSDAISQVYRDYLVRTQVAQDVDDRVTLETSRLRIPAYQAELSFRRGPAQYLAPGTLVEMSSDNLWSSEGALVDKTWRVFRLHLQAVAENEDLERDSQQDSTGFEGFLTLSLEQSDDTCVQMPGFEKPHYPGFIEGKIVSDNGEDTDYTYDVTTDSDTSLDYYTVKIPLWEDKEIVCPFEPYQGSGNVYIPAYRDARVLVAVGLERARIHWLLDWREGAELSEDVQGEQLYFGKTSTSRTTVSHQYEDDAPVFCIERLNDTDTSYIKLEEGTFILEVKEESDG